MDNSLLLDMMATAARQAEDPILPFVGFCHSYDYDEPGEINLRRIKVSYPGPHGGLAVSPLLWRVASHNASDPPVPALGAMVFGFWLKADRSQGVYLGVVQNQQPILNDDPIQDWAEIVEGGTLTIRARVIRLLATELIEVSSRVNEEGYSQIALDQSGDIRFRDYHGETTFERMTPVVKPINFGQTAALADLYRAENYSAINKNADLVIPISWFNRQISINCLGDPLPTDGSIPVAPATDPINFVLSGAANENNSQCPVGTELYLRIATAARIVLKGVNNITINGSLNPSFVLSPKTQRRIVKTAATTWEIQAVNYDYLPYTVIPL